MKKIKITTLICFMILGLATLGIATTSTGSGGSIDLDGTGGMAQIDISAKGLASYSSETTAGAYGGTNEGDQWAVVTGSTAGTTGIHLEFMMRGSAADEDNNLYQILTSDLPTVPGDLEAVSSDPTSGNWTVRGGS